MAGRQGTKEMSEASGASSSRGSAISSTGSRVVGLLKRLDDDAAELRTTNEALLAERSRWAPSPRLVTGLGSSGTTAAAGAMVLALPPTGVTPRQQQSSPLPRMCKDILAEADAHSQRIIDAQRRAQKAESGALDLQNKQQEVVRSAQEAILASETRRKRAEDALLELKMERKEAEARHQKQQDGFETEHLVEIQNICQRTEVLRKEAESVCREIRRQAVEEGGHAKRDIEQLHAEFERRRIALERSLQEHDDECARAIEGANRRIHDAKRGAENAWKDCQNQMRMQHSDADGEVQQSGEHRSDAVAATNMRLAEIDAELAHELQAIAAHEKEMRENRSAEEKALAIDAEVAANVRGRTEACNEFVRCSDVEVARLVAAVEAAGESAKLRAQAVHEAANNKVEGIRVRMEFFAKNAHEKRIIALQDSLNGAIAIARAELCERLRRFSSDACRMTLEAQRAQLKAEQKVDELRRRQAELNAEQAADVEATVKKLHDEKDKIQTEIGKRVLDAQDQMVQYVASMEGEVLEKIEMPAVAEIPLRLPLSGGDGGQLALPQPPIH
eukprot:TRINITY_DN68122_c0_g1_i1.p1 TRINITY_DN68122_c0_g1~~TRINITY_DN68122_c0_g1_i1.p1  ORF type:complete len:560 (+),score=133.45 TRINITY_DN68122_c0_g1_i1:208-1887(+)